MNKYLKYSIFNIILLIMKKYFNIIITLLFVILEIFVLSKSNIVINNFNKVTKICLYNLLPTMFSSILFSQILIKINAQKYIPKFVINIFEKIFNINEEEVIIFLLSIISGAPNNSKMLKDNNNLNNIIHYTNFINPIFIVGTVGGIYLKNIKLSIIILVSNYISNIILGIILRKKNNNTLANKKNIYNNFIDVYYSSIKSTIYTLSVIFSNILFFSIITSFINVLFNFNDLINSIIYGIIEFSNGIYYVSQTNYSFFIKGLLIESIISFSSFCLHMQIISINNNINYTKFIIYRIINVIISISIYTILTIIL